MSQLPPNPATPSATGQGVSHGHKRIVVCCDGTWQDGIVVSQRWKYTNILRLARAINHVDDRSQPPIHQVVFYQSGIGTDNLYDEIVNGTQSSSKVEEAYAFIAQNYRPGDEAYIFLFGFSRGAYTARMVAMFIGAIGVLDRTEMDHFATLFVAYQKRGKSEDQDEIAKLNEQLAPWTSPQALGLQRANCRPDGYSVKVLGVFDTVGSVGMPEELTLHDDKMKTLFGFPDRLLGHHVERAYQALALNEHRADFDCARFEQTEEGRKKGQILRQCWFTGSHCDIGGGYEEHDLSDITLNWMISNIGDALSFDYPYVISLPRPTAVWGTQAPHNSRTGIFALSKEIQRKLPTVTNDVTYEVIHSSVLEQVRLVPNLQETINNNPNLVVPLLPWEEQVKAHWERKLAQAPQGAVQTAERIQENESHHHHHASLFHKAAEAVKHLKGGDQDTEGPGDAHSQYVKAWMGKVATESSVGRMVEEFLK
ncbi:uncharacterized protein TRAVEDRAFT_111927 [Trametes versicolor FP-101664 SS1]|uniref:uncharacterized protein n=1 Tax=Trametes versicolor (strain FP-101664) TaxID=717944 RepID=UPI00046232CD|nr:uncharacterized protein TRAVEDRAFT_111927 [Trametes versicolor FP-101664 SS1]EIW64595.1 hypothetical protein TRAVEDRAFT_111927 [Trametes versicolor FP-101664 SS1]